MRKITFALLISALLTTTTAVMAAGPVTRNGADASGSRNRNGCELNAEGTAMHVKCVEGVGASGPAFVRYRFLKDVGGIRDLASITADIGQFRGEPCRAEWMVRQPRTAARTLRVVVPFGSYCHIRSVTWQQ